jgi:hypothetical protein
MKSTQQYWNGSVIWEIVLWVSWKILFCCATGWPTLGSNLTCSAFSPHVTRAVNYVQWNMGWWFSEVSSFHHSFNSLTFMQFRCGPIHPKLTIGIHPYHALVQWSIELLRKECWMAFKIKMNFCNWWSPFR